MKQTLFLILFLCGTLALAAQQKSIAEKLAQEQLDAYNKRDIEAFLNPYADTVAVYLYPNQFLYKGKETMRKQYADMFKNTPDLFCTIKSRIAVGNKVIDEESVVFNKAQPAMHAVAIYTILNDKIVRVDFITER